MRQIIGVLLIFTALFSCNGQDSFVKSRLKTADSFIECLSNNTPDKILAFTYHTDADDNINNKESREFHISKAYKFIKKFGLPSKDKWIIKYDPENNFQRLVITIPIFNGYDSTFNLIKAGIVLTFPPPQISDKIYRYEIADQYKMKSTIAPTIADSTN